MPPRPIGRTSCSWPPAPATSCPTRTGCAPTWTPCWCGRRWRSASSTSTRCRSRAWSAPTRGVRVRASPRRTDGDDRRRRARRRDGTARVPAAARSACRSRGFDGYPATQALFSHFSDVARCDELARLRPGVSGARTRGAALSRGRRRAAPRVRRRLDVGAALRQRRDQRRRRGDGLAGRGAAAGRRRAGVAAPPRPVSVAGHAQFADASPFATSTGSRGSPIRRARSWGRDGRCCRRPPRSSIRCSRPGFR